MGNELDWLEPVENNNEAIVYKIDLNNYTKKAVSITADRVIKEVVDGNDDPIDTYLKAKLMEDVSKTIQSGIKDFVIKDAKEIKSKFNIQLSVASGRKTYSYDHDEQWGILKAKADQANDDLKKHEELMRKAMDFANVTDDDGVVINPAKFVKQEDETLRVTIPKQ